MLFLEKTLLRSETLYDETANLVSSTSGLAVAMGLCYQQDITKQGLT